MAKKGERFSYPERLGDDATQAARHAEIRRLYLKGNNIFQIAKQVKLGEQMVRKVLREKNKDVYKPHKGGRGVKGVYGGR